MHTIITIREHLGKYNRRVSWIFLDFDWCHYISNQSSCYRVGIDFGWANYHSKEEINKSRAHLGPRLFWFWRTLGTRDS